MMFKMNVDSFIEEKNFCVPLLKKLGYYDSVVWDIKREILEGETSGCKWCECCINDYPELTDKEIQYIENTYCGKDGKFELAIYWDMNIKA